MTHSSDGWDDMHDEQPLDDPLLAGLLSELRSWGSGPAPVPSAALATLLADTETVHPVPLRRKKMLVSKLAGLGLAAKVALGAGVAAAAITTAGATGVLPGPVQDSVAAVVNAVSPLDLPGSTPDLGILPTDLVGTDVPTTLLTLPGGEQPGDEQPGDEAADEATDGDEGGQPSSLANHGACVSAVAQDHTLSGREHGQAVSEVAKSDCGKTDETTVTSTSTTTSSVPGDGASGTADSGPSANSGPGNSKGHGNGNGNSGRK